ncbi:sulfurtransferase [Desulfuromonas versatilis]|uniref:Sulfurtransferase n=1 Tax=Desulfuromonas versatilis TaxID=2802975 RepID=A0ABN6E3W0_9BACT|nr:rhodanese-like domain-containing protein [Desulfuromonas versatilis]BCR05861.1 sulfurtransferase [Desulfuromonas versatilis]
MAILDFFRPVRSMTAQQAKEFMAVHHPDEFHLVDVRQPAEYQKRHLPGAVLIPMGQLEEGLLALDRGKTTIVYCSSGVRSRSAAAVLENAGFADVWNLGGGLQAWDGLVARGAPEPDLAYFDLASTPEQYVALAWWLEEGARRFYAQLAEMLQDREAASLFRELTTAEEHHKATLLAVYEGLAGRPAREDFPSGVLSAEPRRGMMEGGVAVEEALEWARGRQIKDIVELAIAVETNAYDRYLILQRELSDEHACRVFEVISDEERRHLRKLTQLFEHFL